MGWIEVEDGVYAKEPEPDPEMIVDLNQLEQEIADLQNQIQMRQAELESLQQEVFNLESELARKISLREEILSSVGEE